MILPTLLLTVRIGAANDIPIRVESDTLTYATITGMSKSAPLRITAPSHGLPNGWRACVQNAIGMTEINVNDPIRDGDLRRVLKVDANTIDFPGVNASGWRTWTSGGQVAYYAPYDLSGFSSARMDVKDAIDGSALASFSTSAGTLQIDSQNQVLWLHLTVAQASALPAGNHLFDIELVPVSGAIVAVCSPDSLLTVLAEITTS